jgi:tRNA(fMet)-specific endonuclease VapC
MGLIIDSSVAIAAERRGDSVEKLIQTVIAFASDQRAALSAIGLTELIHGIHRAKTEAQRLRRREFVEELARDLSVHAYTIDTARIAGRIDAEQRAAGNTIPFGDLLIGATALSIGFGVLTVNLRHFRLIPGLDIVRFPV